MRVLVVTSEWPSSEHPYSGIFVEQEVSRLRQAGLDVEVFHFRGGMRPANYLRAWLGLRSRLRSKSFDLIHAQFGQGGLVALPPPRPLVVTFRGSDLLGIVDAGGRYTLRGRLLGWVSRLVAAQADEVVVVSERLRSRLPGRRAHLIPTGIDLDLFKPMPRAAARRRLGLPLEGRYVLFAADPDDPVKRYPLAQAAVRGAQAQMPSLELLVTRRVPHRDMPLYMNASDALLLTSLHEGSPNVVKEALACGLPVVSVDVGDVRARLAGLQACAVCPADAPHAISRELVRVLRSGGNPEGRARVLELGWDAAVRRLIEVYRQALQ